MARQAIIVQELAHVTEQITVKDSKGNTVDLTGMTVYFYAHDRNAADGTNLVEKDTTGGGVTVVGSATDGVIDVEMTAADLVLDEDVEDMVDGIWQVRWTNGSTVDDYTLPQPFYCLRNRVRAG